MMNRNSTITLSSLYSTGQCLLSVLGSIGVILLFAGIPQLIYAPHLSPGSLMTFLLGALLISLMVAGNAFIGYKYRQFVRERQEESRNSPARGRSEDKPPSYEDILQEEGLPPPYNATLIKAKPPRYEDLVTDVFNWDAVRSTPNCHQPSAASAEVPIILPIQRQNSNELAPTLKFVSTVPCCLENLDSQNASHNSLSRACSTESTMTISEEDILGFIKKHLRRKGHFATLPRIHKITISARPSAPVGVAKETIPHRAAHARPSVLSWVQANTTIEMPSEDPQGLSTEGKAKNTNEPQNRDEKFVLTML